MGGMGGMSGTGGMGGMGGDCKFDRTVVCRTSHADRPSSWWCLAVR